jgi:hypothetical protein
VIPRTKGAAQDHQFAYVVGRVIGGEEDLAEVRLPVAVRNAGGEIDPRVGREILQRLAVAAKLID